MEIASSSSKSVPRSRKNIPWVEKYRPERVDDIAHQEEVVQTLKTSIKQGSLPHLLFHGSPGTGKTTTILAVARELYGPELYKSRIMELNASDERGIAVVREKIKVFAQGAVGTQKTSGYPCPRFKLIILDEADTMTPDAQSALRRIMETYSKVTRFCLICNYVTRIIEPLASRCAKFRFRPLPLSAMEGRIRHIAALEGVHFQGEGEGEGGEGGEGGERGGEVIQALMMASGGDMRRAVTLLQSAHQLTLPFSSLPPTPPPSSSSVVEIDEEEDIGVGGGGGGRVGGVGVSGGGVGVGGIGVGGIVGSGVNSEVIIEISGQVPPRVLTSIFSLLFPPRPPSSSSSSSFVPPPSFDSLRELTENIISEAYPIHSLLSQLTSHVISLPSSTTSSSPTATPTLALTDLQKAHICEKIADIELNLLDGSNEFLQLLDLIAFMSRIIHKEKSPVDSVKTFH